MLILRKLVFTLLTFSTALYLLHPSDAAAYWFNVKVVNNSGDKIRIESVGYKPKSGARKGCSFSQDIATTVIQSGSDTLDPRCYGNVQKWQRQIQVQIKCDYKNESDYGARRTLLFPRGSKKFFARDHAAKNGDKYVTRIKASDC